MRYLKRLVYSSDAYQDPTQTTEFIFSLLTACMTSFEIPENVRGVLADFFMTLVTGVLTLIHESSNTRMQSALAGEHLPDDYRPSLARAVLVLIWTTSSYNPFRTMLLQTLLDEFYSIGRISDHRDKGAELAGVDTLRRIHSMVQEVVYCGVWPDEISSAEMGNVLWKCLTENGRIEEGVVIAWRICGMLSATGLVNCI
jgi:hypothetical protein